MMMAAIVLIVAGPAIARAGGLIEMQVSEGGRKVMKKAARDGTPVKKVEDWSTELYKLVPGKTQWAKYEKELSFEQSTGQIPYYGVLGMTIGLFFVMALALIYFVFEMLRQYGHDWLAILALVLGLLLAPVLFLKFWEALETHVMGNVIWELETRTPAQVAFANQAVLTFVLASVALVVAMLAAAIVPALFPKPHDLIPEPSRSMVLVDGKLRQFKVWDDSLVIGQRWYAISKAKAGYCDGKLVLTLPNGDLLVFIEVASAYYSGPSARRDAAGEWRIEWGRALTET
jgi:hypothetical protein